MLLCGALLLGSVVFVPVTRHRGPYGLTRRGDSGAWLPGQGVGRASGLRFGQW